MVTGFAASNRPQSGNLLSIRREPRVEVDTFAIAFPVVDVDTTGATVTTQGYGTPNTIVSGKRPLEGGGFLAWGRGGMAWAEASLPKRFDGQNVSALRWEEALDAGEALYREAAAWCELDRAREGHKFERSKVVRIDLVRDFEGVADVSWLLDGLAGVRQKGRVGTKRFSDRERGGSATLSAGNAAWLCTLYDKFAESLGADGSEPGHLRFEARCRQRLLQSAGAVMAGGKVERVGDLSEVKAAGMRRQQYRRVGFDREVVTSARLVDVVAAAPDLTPRARRELWAYLTLPDPGFSRPVVRKYAAIAADLGVTARVDGWEGPKVSVSLDYDAGVQRVERAA